MKKTLLAFTLLLSGLAFSQDPVITSWLQNTTNTGSYYTSGNSTAIDNGILSNCQVVEYSTDWVYVSTHGIPAYPTGPFLDGNPSQAEDQDVIYRFPIVPTENQGTPTETGMGNIGVFINGTSVFNYADGVAWNTTTGALCGGPGNSPCPGGMGATQVWNRDAIPAEMGGFDCSKGHPAMGNYHHHQNPSAFKLDLTVLSTVCNLYDAEGLYAIDSMSHSPLIGYAYDGFPIYGAYGYKNTDGTGGIVRMKSGYELGIGTDRDTYPDGTDVDDGPAVDATYFAGYFREDYQWMAHAGESDYLDVHNGRVCVTPEYPDGIYCYFATVDENWNSAYPYMVGPTFYGNVVASTVTNITESTTTYTSTASISEKDIQSLAVSIFPNPASDLVAVQIGGLVTDDLHIELMDISGKMILETTIQKGSTIAYFDVATIYAGTYLLRISNENGQRSERVVIK